MTDKCKKCGEPLKEWYALGRGKVVACSDITCPRSEEESLSTLSKELIEMHKGNKKGQKLL